MDDNDRPRKAVAFLGILANVTAETILILCILALGLIGLPLALLLVFLHWQYFTLIMWAVIIGLVIYAYIWGSAKAKQ